MSLTTYGGNALLDGTPLPATLYAQLHTGAPGDLGADNVSVIVPDRLAFTRSAAASKVAGNASEVSYADALAGTIEDVVAISVHDAASGGNAWLVEALDAVEVKPGDPVTFAIGALRLRLI